MNYIFHQRLTYQDQGVIKGIRAAIVESEPEVVALYARHLTEAGVEASVFFDLRDAIDFATQQKPQAVLVGISLLTDKDYLLLEALREDHPSMVLVTMGDDLLEEYDIDKLMALGVSCHINRQFSSPKDVSTTVKQLLGL